jgi:hypothetical protein
MPEFTADEADRCPHCNAILRQPPDCCTAMMDEHEEDEQLKRREREQEYFDDPDGDIAGADYP